MKKKLTVFALSLVLALACVSLAACKKDNGAKLNIADYAVAVDDPVFGTETSKLYTTATEFTGGSIEDVSEYGMAIVATSDSKYKLYNADKGEYALGGAAYEHIAFASDMSGIIDNQDNMAEILNGFVFAMNGTESDATFGVYDILGNELLPLAKYDMEDFHIASQVMYVNGKIAPAMLVKITYKTTETDAKEQNKYFEIKIDLAAKSVNFVAVDESNVSQTPVSNKVGDVLTDTNIVPLVQTNDIFPVEKYTEYGISSFNGTSGTTYTVYESGKKKGEFTVKSGDILATLGKYVIYTEMQTVPSDAKEGYNTHVTRGNTVTKYNVSYYRYDFVKDKTTKLDVDFFITGITPLYNFADKIYDAAIVQGVPFNDGVAMVERRSYYYESDSMQTYATDATLRVAYDLSAKPFTMENLPVCLRSGKNARYLIGGCITDKNLNVIANLGDASKVTAYKDPEVVTFFYNDYYGAVDFDGKVVMEAKYEKLDLIGGYACTRIKDKEGEDDVYYLVSPTAPDGKKVSEVGEHIAHPETSLQYSFLFAQNETTGKVYNPAGTNILTLENVDEMIVKATTDNACILEFLMTDSQIKTYILA